MLFRTHSGWRAGVTVALISCLIPGTGWAGKDISEMYEEYVNEIIPLSFQVAERDAYIREFDLFVDRASLAQSHLALASEDAGLIADYATQTKPSGADFCPVGAEGIIDVPATLREIFLTSEILNAADRIDLHLKAFRTIHTQAGQACEQQANFESYKVDRLDVRYYVPQEIGTFDGVYVVYAQGGENGEARSESSGGGFASIPLIGSIYQVIKNRIENGKIKDLWRRLDSSRVKDADYAKYATDSCRKILQDHEPTFARYEKLYTGLENVLRKVPAEGLRKRRTALHACLVEYERQFTAYLGRLTGDRVRVRLQAQTDRETNLRLTTVVNLRLHAGLARLADLKALPCGQGLANIRRVKADIALSRLMRLQNQERLLPYAEQGLRERARACGEESL